jgi:hypothetical protein
MKIYKRKVELSEEQTCKINYFGYNSNSVFTIKVEFMGDELDKIINLDKQEFEKLKKFIGEIR